jgi:hypothetical protein
MSTSGGGTNALNPILGTGQDTKNFEQDLNGNARIGANVKVSDELTGGLNTGQKMDLPMCVYSGANGTSVPAL